MKLTKSIQCCGVCTVKAIIGDATDYTITNAPLMFGATASPTNCVQDDIQCFYFEAEDDDIKEQNEKFQLMLETSDLGVEFCYHRAHVEIQEDPNDGKGIRSLQSEFSIDCALVNVLINICIIFSCSS